MIVEGKGNAATKHRYLLTSSRNYPHYGAQYDSFKVCLRGTTQAQSRTHPWRWRVDAAAKSVTNDLAYVGFTWSRSPLPGQAGETRGTFSSLDPCRAHHLGLSSLDISEPGSALLPC